ncbi:MAG: hypothetical protein HZA77_02060 [Candidatus Schekmanbacteria bacterium]|nr:hypothetical protein [Candidatus Schekmanbacteria bacterium]
MSEKKLLREIKKKISEPPRDLSNSEVYNDLCSRYGEAIRPGLEAVDRLQAKSMVKAFTKVVR